MPSLPTRLSQNSALPNCTAAFWFTTIGPMRPGVGGGLTLESGGGGAGFEIAIVSGQGKISSEINASAGHR